MADEQTLLEVLRLYESDHVEIEWVIPIERTKIERGTLALPYKATPLPAGQSEIIHLNKDASGKDFEIIPIGSIIRITDTDDSLILWQRPSP